MFISKPKLNIILFITVILINMIWYLTPVFSQEGDAAERTWKYLYIRRAYPFDSIPAGGYQNAISQREALIQSDGYQFSAPSEWELVGPKPFKYNPEDEITYSGRISTVNYDSRDPEGKTIYITGFAGGVWKTTNNGENWIERNGNYPNNLPTLISGAFAIDAVRNILYFGGGYLTIYYGGGGGMRIFKSTDDGVNWTSISNGIPIGSGISKIAISPQNPDIIFTATFHGLYKTTNGGNSWDKVIPITGADSVCTDVCFTNSGNIVYASGPSYNYWEGTYFCGIGLWKSTDGGNNFTVIKQEESHFPHDANVKYNKTLLATSKASEDYLYVLNYDKEGGIVYVYKTTNGGVNFDSYNIGSTIVNFHLVIRCSDVDPRVCFAGYEYLRKTIDGGLNWGWATPPHVDNLAFDFNPVYPNKVCVGCDGGVFRSDDYININWISMNQDLSLTLFWQIASNKYNSNFVVGSMHDYGYGFNANINPLSTQWLSTDRSGGDGGQMVSSPFKSNYFVGSTTCDCYYYHSSNGTSFGPSYDFLETTTWCTDLTPMTNSPTQPGIIYNARFNRWEPAPVRYYILRSSNYGATWGGSQPWRWFDLNIHHIAPISIAISQSNPDIMIMNMGNEDTWWHFTNDLRSRLYKSTDGGLHWYSEGNPPNAIIPIVMGGDNGTPDRYFTDVEFDPKDENIVYLTVSGYYYPDDDLGHVFKSTDGGFTWDNISNGLPDIPVNDIIVHYPDCNSKELIIATDAGIYISDATDISWEY